MSRRLRYDIPGRDLRVALEDLGLPPSLGRWAEIFGEDARVDAGLVVDIGFGRGEALIDAAGREPRQAFVGIERSFKRTLKMARRLARLGVSNVRIVQARAEEAVARAFPERGLRAAWINFPDPWPKDRHARRRLVQGPFVHDLALRLAPGGELLLATDDPDYAAQMDDVLSREPLLENRYAPEPFRREVGGRVPTAYELEWRALGRSFHFFAYRRKCEGDA